MLRLLLIVLLVFGGEGAGIPKKDEKNFKKPLTCIAI